MRQEVEKELPLAVFSIGQSARPGRGPARMALCCPPPLPTITDRHLLFPVVL